MYDFECTERGRKTDRKYNLCRNTFEAYECLTILFEIEELQRTWKSYRRTSHAERRKRSHLRFEGNPEWENLLHTHMWQTELFSNLYLTTKVVMSSWGGPQKKTRHIASFLALEHTERGKEKQQKSALFLFWDKRIAEGCKTWRKKRSALRKIYTPTIHTETWPSPHPFWEGSGAILLRRPASHAHVEAA